MRYRNYIRVIGAFAVLGSLGGCSNTVHQNCCYQGPHAAAYLRDVSINLKDGRSIPLPQALPGYESRTSLFGSGLPFDEAIIKRWATPFLEPYLNAHDANQNGVIEEPEMIALYVIELARGRGLDAITLQVQGRPVTALQTTSADISGLVDYSKLNRRALDRQTRRLFDDIEFYGPQIMDRPDDRPDGHESKASWMD